MQNSVRCRIEEQVYQLMCEKKQMLMVKKGRDATVNVNLGEGYALHVFMMLVDIARDPWSRRLTRAPALSSEDGECSTTECEEDRVERYG